MLQRNYAHRLHYRQSLAKSLKRSFSYIRASRERYSSIRQIPAEVGCRYGPGNVAVTAAFLLPAAVSQPTTIELFNDAAAAADDEEIISNIGLYIISNLLYD